MKTKNQIFIIFLILGTLFLFSTDAALSDPGDTIPEAITASLGEKSGILTATLENDYYNFSGSRFRTYNFTMAQSTNNQIQLYLYNENGTLLSSNTSAPFNNRTLIASGYDHYIIRIQADFEFIVLPANYSLIIEELIVGDEGESLARAKNVTEGNYTDTFELYNDAFWYNFTAITDHTYNITVSQDPSYIYMAIYNLDMTVLESDWNVEGYISFSVTGNDKYVIYVAASEFTIFSSTFTLSIRDITPVSTTSSSSTTTGDPTSGTDTSVPINIYFVILALLSLPIMTRNLRKD
ncbi:MAG: hypothetical protein ACXACX_15710 [Candidatus Hodarchaeales archaeon]|jgi:hypothetical protein